ncbi:MAG: hypothetical protein V7K97_18350 [Nostoc sp.]
MSEKVLLRPHPKMNNNVRIINGRLISCTRRLEVAATQAKPACAG